MAHGRPPLDTSISTTFSGHPEHELRHDRIQQCTYAFCSGDPLSKKQKHSDTPIEYDITIHEMKFDYTHFDRYQVSVPNGEENASDLTSEGRENTGCSQVKPDAIQDIQPTHPPTNWTIAKRYTHEGSPLSADFVDVNFCMRDDCR
jgi:hypothetical protein